MSSLPLTEAILLEIHQSFGGKAYPTLKKNKFAAGQTNAETLTDMGSEIIESIFDALNMELQEQDDAITNLMEFGNAYKSVELNTWTFAADERQIVWTLLSHFYIPGLARRVGFWSLEQVLDKGMPGGRFWYLPEPTQINGQPSLYLPVAQVVDWLLDLLGESVEQFADSRSQDTDSVQEAIRRDFYNWRNDTLIKVDSINKYFSDKTTLAFNGVFLLSETCTASEQFAQALEFVKLKCLSADKLRSEIPMTQAGRLESILASDANPNEQAEFVKCIAERYAAPSMKTIRQRLLLARAVQDGYVRLLKFLCPNVDRLCADPQQNKLLQLFSIYKLVYNLTIDAWRRYGDRGEYYENLWFEEHLPEWDKVGLFLSILPSLRNTASVKVAHWITRRFFEMQPGAELEDYVVLDSQLAPPIIQRNIEQATSFADEIKRERNLVERLAKSPSPWLTLQREHCFWVVTQVAQNSNLTLKARDAAIQRLRELASSPSQTVQVIGLELHHLLNGDRHNRPKNVREKVQALLDEAEASEGFEFWKMGILQYKAKHMLACNDFEGARSLFLKAFDAGLERNYGPLRGEVARDLLAVSVANGKLIPNNHKKYYRGMLAGGMVDGEEIPSLEDSARWASVYFWESLYKPYPDLNIQKPVATDVYIKLVEGLMPLFAPGNKEALQNWINGNRKLLNSTMPNVEGNSILMLLIKLYGSQRDIFLNMKSTVPPHPQNENRRFECFLNNWEWFLGALSKECPGQLNIPDLKRQTPLMLMAEKGNAAMVQIMLTAGADPDAQDWQGMTALHSACKSRNDECVDLLLDHPCKLDKRTMEERSPLHTACWAGNPHAVKRLTKLAPELAWQRDSHGNTPLELADKLIENPENLARLAAQRTQNGGWTCAPKKELETIVELLEQVPPCKQD